MLASMREPAEVRFAALLDRTSVPGCVLYLGPKNAKGFGVFRRRCGDRIPVHVYARDLAGRPRLPIGHRLRNLCGHKHCCTLDHWAEPGGQKHRRVPAARRIDDLSPAERTDFATRFRNGAKVGALEKRFSMNPVEVERLVRRLLAGVPVCP